MSIGYYVNLRDEFAKNLLSLKIKTIGMDMKRGGYSLRIFSKIIYKLDNIINPQTKITMIKTKKFESSTQMQKIKRISNFTNRTKINKKHVINWWKLQNYHYTPITKKHECKIRMGRKIYDS